MRTSAKIKSLAIVLALAFMLVAGLASNIRAEANNVTISSGIVLADQRGEAVVLDDGTVVEPSNLHGLLTSGQVAPGDQVTVQIVTDRRHKHHGHVTILK